MKICIFTDEFGVPIMETDEELLEFMRSIPLHEGMTLATTEMILPMTVDEVWTAIWSDQRTYNLDATLSFFGDQLLKSPNWQTSAVDQMDGVAVMGQRDIESKVKLPPNPFFTYARNVSYNFLLRQDETGMIVYLDNKVSGALYADAIDSWLRWEVYQPTPQSTRAVIRNSYGMAWNYKPWVATGLMWECAEKKIKESIEYIFDNFLLQTAEDFLERKRERLEIQD